MRGVVNETDFANLQPHFFDVDLEQREAPSICDPVSVSADLSALLNGCLATTFLFLAIQGHRKLSL